VSGSPAQSVAQALDPDRRTEIALEGCQVASRLVAEGDPLTALNVVLQSLQIQDTDVGKRIFVDCVRRVRFTQQDPEARAMLMRALTERWARPSELATTGFEFVRLNPVIAGHLGRPPVGVDALAALGSDPLLCLLLAFTPVCDVEMERFLTMARRAMLEVACDGGATHAVAGAAIDFCAALTCQSFINEYVFACPESELRMAEGLRDAISAVLQARTEVDSLRLLAAAAYAPLSLLPHASRLLEAQWPESVAAVLVQQIREPEEEHRLRESVPRLTGIENEVSRLVRNQYEENPYPRWVKAATGGGATELSALLRRRFPLAPLKRRTWGGGIDILIAGCGTGQHAIETSRLIEGARVLAVDLSLTSLGYARRKTAELGLTGIEFAQADLLQLGSALDRRFDLVESVGVLHHLADPWAGWRSLLSLLRPGGIMRLGFYSALARRHIVKAREFIAEKGYRPTAEDIRRCRQDLMAPDARVDLRSVIDEPDFFSTSGCRDLLFHVEEHRLTLTEIGTFLRENWLTFLGFDLDLEIRRAYGRRFPDDVAGINLEHWQRFEGDNPDTFSSMYQFWVQKAV
jgi:SAM-dependent methyltransferase